MTWPPASVLVLVTVDVMLWRRSLNEVIDAMAYTAVVVLSPIVVVIVVSCCSDSSVVPKHEVSRWRATENQYDITFAMQL